MNKSMTKNSISKGQLRKRLGFPSLHTANLSYYPPSTNHEAFNKQLFRRYLLEHKKRHKTQLHTAARVAFEI